MKPLSLLLLALILVFPSWPEAVPEYTVTVAPRPDENVAQPCTYRASFPLATVRSNRHGSYTDITSFYSDPAVLAFAKRNELALVLALQCPAKIPPTGEKGEMDMNPAHGLGRSLFTALDTLGQESRHPELGKAKLIVLGFSGTGAYFAHFVAYAPDRVVAAILANPGQTEPYNLDHVKLDMRGIAVPELIIVGGIDTISGTVKPYAFYRRNHAKSAEWVYLIQNNVPHCCINNIRSFMLEWLQEVIRSRHPDPEKPLQPINMSGGWYGSFHPCKPLYEDHWGLPLWNVCEAHIRSAKKALPQMEMPAGSFLTESLAREWLEYVKQKNHPLTSFPRPGDPMFGAPEQLKK